MGKHLEKPDIHNLNSLPCRNFLNKRNTYLLFIPILYTISEYKSSVFIWFVKIVSNKVFSLLLFNVLQIELSEGNVIIVFNLSGSALRSRRLSFVILYLYPPIHFSKESPNNFFQTTVFNKDGEDEEGIG